MSGASSRYDHQIAEFVGAVGRRAWLVMICAGLLTLLAVACLVTSFKINTDTEQLLSSELSYRQNNAALDAAFPAFEESVVVVLDADNPDRLEDAALELIDALKQRPDAFLAVLDPMSEPFLNRNGLFLLSVEELDALSVRLAEAQPFLASLWADTSIATLFSLLADALEQAADGGRTPAPLGLMLTGAADVIERLAAGEDATLSWRNLLDGAEAPSRRLILVDPVLDYGSLNPARKTLAALREIRADKGWDGSGAVTARFTGKAALKQDELRSVRDGLGLAGGVSFLLVTTLLFFGLGSARLVLSVLTTLVLGLVWTAAAAILLVGQLNLISVAFAVLFLGISVDFGIHFCLRFRERQIAGDPVGQALAHAADGLGGVLSLCALTAAIAFYSFFPTAYVGLAELGVIAGTGMFIALAANFTVLPAMITLLPPSTERGKFVKKEPDGWGFAGKINRLARRSPRGVVAGALCLSVIAAFAVPHVRFDFDPLNLKEQGTESVSTLLELADDKRTTPYIAEVPAPDLEAARALAERLDLLKEVAATVTLSRFLPGDEVGEKTEIIGDLAFQMAPSLPDGGGRPAFDATKTMTAVATLLSALDRLVSSGAGDSDLRQASDRAAKALRGIDEAALETLNDALIGGFPRRAAALRRSLDAEPFGVGDLPAIVREQYLSPGGAARVQVYPAQDLRNPAHLESFVEAVGRAAPAATGTPFIIREGSREVRTAFQTAFTLAVAVIFLLLLVVTRSPRDAMIIFAPLILAALLTTAVVVIFGLAFNFANIIVLPLLFGLSVDYGIHLVFREREEIARTGGTGRRGAFATSTPKAVLLSALTTIGSFGSIALSAHPGTASMGLLLMIAISLTLPCTLVVLPALLELRRL